MTFVMYNNICCGMIAVKFEVTVQEIDNSAERMSSQETDDKSLYRTDMVYNKQKQRVKNTDVRTKAGNTRRSVQSPLVVLKLKVRKGGDFFYGKSSNENYSQSV